MSRTAEIQAMADADGVTLCELLCSVIAEGLTPDEQKMCAHHCAKCRRMALDPLRWYDVPESLLGPEHYSPPRCVPPWTTHGGARRGLVKADPANLPAGWYTLSGNLRAAITYVGVESDARALYSDPASDYYRPDDA